MIHALHLLFPIVPICIMFHSLLSPMYNAVVCGHCSIAGLLEPPLRPRLLQFA